MQPDSKLIRAANGHSAFGKCVLLTYLIVRLIKILTATLLISPVLFWTAMNLICSMLAEVENDEIVRQVWWRNRKRLGYSAFSRKSSIRYNKIKK